MSINDNFPKNSPFSVLNIHSDERGQRWSLVVDSLHEVLVDANLNALDGALMIYLNLTGIDLLLTNIVLGESFQPANNYLGISLAAQPDTFKLVNVYPNAGYLQNSERICRGADLISAIKAMLVIWINGGAFTYSKPFSGTVPKPPLLARVDDEVIDLFTKRILELYPIALQPKRGSKQCSWSILNPLNQNHVFNLINSGNIFFTSREKFEACLLSKKYR